eukprot:SAG11_NODE_2884_length_2870_cov_1.601949_3_plen_170_part_00
MLSTVHEGSRRSDPLQNSVLEKAVSVVVFMRTGKGGSGPCTIHDIVATSFVFVFRPTHPIPTRASLAPQHQFAARFHTSARQLEDANLSQASVPSKIHRRWCSPVRHQSRPSAGPARSAMIHATTRKGFTIGINFTKIVKMVFGVYIRETVGLVLWSLYVGYCFCVRET